MMRKRRRGMRLDKYLSAAGECSRRDCAREVRAGLILIDGIPARRSDDEVKPGISRVTRRGAEIEWREHVYIMLNKPEGYVSATEDRRDGCPVVTELCEERDRARVFPCGRLDKNTLGLMILTNDGEGAHRVLSPKHHVPKLYRFKTKFPLTDNDVKKLEGGTDIGGYVTKPCKITLDDDGGVIELTEGKYHQIKRMAESVGNKITYLERISFGGVMLDKNLGRGEWRYLTLDEEEKIFGKRELSGKE